MAFEPTVAAFTHASSLAFSLLWRNAASGVAAVGIRRIYVTRLFGFPDGARCDNCTLLRLAFSLLIIPEGRKLLRSDASRSLSYILYSNPYHSLVSPLWRKVRRLFGFPNGIALPEVTGYKRVLQEIRSGSSDSGRRFLHTSKP